LFWSNNLANTCSMDGVPLKNRAMPAERLLTAAVAVIDSGC